MNNEALKKALKTFVQTALGYIVINIALVDFSVEGTAVKSALIGVAVAAAAAGLSAVINLEQRGAGGMSFDGWVNAHIGRRTDFDGSYGVQCVDLVDCYIAECLALKKGFWGNAKDWWIKRNSSKWLKSNFEFVTPKYKSGELLKGDIGVRTSGKYGHIFIVAESDINGRFKYYDQNATGNGDAMMLREKPYTSDYITGIIRPKNRENLKNVSYITGKVYRLTADLKVRKGAGVGFEQKKRSELSLNAKLHSYNSAYAVLKKGTKVTVLEVKETQNSIWLRIPSGWIAAYYNGNTYVK